MIVVRIIFFKFLRFIITRNRLKQKEKTSYFYSVLKTIVENTSVKNAIVSITDEKLVIHFNKKKDNIRILECSKLVLSFFYQTRLNIQDKQLHMKFVLNQQKYLQFL